MMGQLTVLMQQHNGITCIETICLTEQAAFDVIEDRIQKRITGLSVKDSIQQGQCVTVFVDDKDLKKILKQGYLYAAFDYHPNNNGYGIPLVIKATKTGLVKAYRLAHDPKATEHTLFNDCFNGAAFTLDKNNIPAGFSGYQYSGLKIF